MARISVLIGVYDCAKTLNEALESLYAQTYPGFKVILCDDGSKDNTYEIAKRLAESRGNVILIKNERNMGLNYTLNHCLEYADTEYIARMDGDDISEPTRFEKEIQFLDSHPEYDIVSTQMTFFDENGEFRWGKGGGEPRIEDFSKGTPFCHAPCMVRTKAMKAVGGYSVSDKLLRVEDYHLWIKMYKAGYRGYNLPERLYKMRDDRNAIARRTAKNRINEARVRYLACRELHLPLKSYIYILKPLVLILLPTPIYKYLHSKKL